ncbi:MAG: argininosuccinate synthase [Candidatus Chisholmbacteria bacterium]|nr:argininosuccinate synthase [Candidatus Chisholmbacteria bacterium]
MAKMPKQSSDYQENKKLKKKCLLMYSGGVDTSVCVHLLQKYYGYEVITLTIDVCQDKTWAKAMAKKAKKLGAVKAIVVDAKDEYADKYLSQIIKANGFYDDYYPLGTSIARPWQAKIGVEVALKEKVDAMAHGNKGRGAGAFQFDMVFNFLIAKDMKLVAPIGDWWPTRQEEIDYAYQHKIPVPVPQDNPFSYDDNIMSNAINYGDIDEIDKLVPEEAFKWTVAVEQAPDKAELVTLEFKHGLPVKLDGKQMKLAALIQHLNFVGGKHGIGRIDMIENGLYGNKVKWVYEAPAAQILIEAHKELEKLVLPKQTQYFKHEIVDKQWAKLVYHALVYSPLAKALMAFIEDLQAYVNGEVMIKLYKGKAVIVKRKCAGSLVGLEAKTLDLKWGAVEVPYGFEEYSFSSKHPEVVEKHLGAI